MTPLAKALLRSWWTPELALAHARVGLAEAIASDCPHRTREWAAAVECLERAVGFVWFDWTPPTLEEILETMESFRPQLKRALRVYVERD